MRFKVFLLCLCAFHALFSEEIRVYLSTQSPLKPLYLGVAYSPDQSVTDGYLADLHAVLHFDLRYNGKVHLLPTQPEKEAAVKNFIRTVWKGCSYVVSAEVQNKTFLLKCFDVQTGAVHAFPPVQLSCRLAQDRKIVHRLADALFKTLFGSPGVASTQILYSLKEKKGSHFVSEIWCCDWDGAGAHPLTSENSYSITPVFVPASSSFLYVSYKTGQPKIVIGSPASRLGKRLINLKGNQLLPAIAPQKNKIAFISDVAGQADLFVQAFDPQKGPIGSPVKLFSYRGSTQASPSFSPDGLKIAFVSDKDGSPRIYTLSATQPATPTLISKQNGESSCPSWSPDGKKIAYSAKTKGTRQIWIYDFETRKEWQLTEGPGNKENPSWAKDSTHLVFNSTDGHTSELYLVNLHQPDVVKISKGSGVKHYPSWGQ